MLQNNEETKQYVHLLNSTLTAAERTVCYILQNYQREDGVGIPEVFTAVHAWKHIPPFQEQTSPQSQAKGKGIEKSKRA